MFQVRFHGRGGQGVFLGRPLPGAPLLGALAATTGVVSLRSLEAAIGERFPAQLAERNVLAARAAHDLALAHA